MYSTEDFVFDKEEKTLTAEASSLGIPAGRVQSQIDILSPRTGRVGSFFLAKVDRRTEQYTGAIRFYSETAGWVYRPTTITLKSIPELANFEVLIIND